MSTIKYCPICKRKCENPFFDDEVFIRCSCPDEHKNNFIDTGISSEDFESMNGFLTDDISFIEAMIDLKQSDPIEYQLKMSQFKANLSQTKAEEERNVPHCPTCGSTKLSKVSTASKAGSVFMFGLLSQKVKKTWHCNNCGYEW